MVLFINVLLTYFDDCVCRFIGELFKLKMLTEGIMHDCIRRLLRARDEESLECLCRLLTTIGCDLDKDRSRVSVYQL